MEHAEIKIVFGLKSEATHAQAGVMAKKMIKALDLNELILLEEAKVQQILADIAIDEADTEAEDNGR